MKITLEYDLDKPDEYAAWHIVKTAARNQRCIEDIAKYCEENSNGGDGLLVVNGIINDSEMAPEDGYPGC